MIERDDLLRLIAERAPEAVVVPAWTPAREWPHFSQSDLAYCNVAAMGAHSSVALGIALARPERKVIVLDGDGSLLMNLGGLVTEASLSLPNFIHFVLENECYEMTGGQPIPGAGRASFFCLALAAGYPRAYEYAEIEALRRDIDEILTGRGPVFVDVKTSKGSRLERAPRRYQNAQEAAEALRRALGVRDVEGS